MPTPRDYQHFLESLEKIVNESKPASDKAEALKSEMGDSDMTNLLELLSWFEGDL